MQSFKPSRSEYIGIIFLLLIIFLTSCADRGSKSPETKIYYYAYVPRIDPLTGGFAWKMCGANTSNSYRVSTIPLELDDETFLFVRTISNNFYEKLEYIPPSRATPETLPLFDLNKPLNYIPDPDHHGYLYGFVSLYDLRNKKNFTGDKFDFTKIYLKPEDAIRNATLYDSVWHGVITDTIRKQLLPDPVTGSYCNRIDGLGKSRCDDEEFRTEKCGTIPCYSIDESLNPFFLKVLMVIKIFIHW